jgi:hypothetical protein
MLDKEPMPELPVAKRGNWPSRTGRERQLHRHTQIGLDQRLREDARRSPHQVPFHMD